MARVTAKCRRPAHWILSAAGSPLAGYYCDVTANDVEVISGGSPPYRDMIREKMPWSVQRYILDSNCRSQRYSEDDGGFIFTLEHCARTDLDEEIDRALAGSARRGSKTPE